MLVDLYNDIINYTSWTLNMFIYCGLKYLKKSHVIEKCKMNSNTNDIKLTKEGPLTTCRMQRPAIIISRWCVYCNLSYLEWWLISWFCWFVLFSASFWCLISSQLFLPLLKVHLKLPFCKLFLNASLSVTWCISTSLLACVFSFLLSWIRECLHFITRRT